MHGKWTCAEVQVVQQFSNISFPTYDLGSEPSALEQAPHLFIVFFVLALLYIVHDTQKLPWNRPWGLPSHSLRTLVSRHDRELTNPQLGGLKI